ncbi:MAG: FN3 associated domain-containing protein [Lachnospiraceae bacterium]
MKCAYCGTEIELGSSYCPHCGKEVQIVSETSVFEDDILQSMLDGERDLNDPDVKKKPTSSAPAKQDMVAKVRGERAAEKEKKQSEKSKKKEKGLNIILVLFTVLVVVAIIVAVKFKIDYDHAHDFDYQYQKGQEIEKTGNRSEAMKFYENALTLDQNNTDVRFKLAALYETKQEDDKAKQLLEEIIVLDKTNTEAYEALIALYEKKKDYDAILSLKNVAEPSDTKTLALFDDYVVADPEFTVSEGTYNEDFDVVIEADVGCDVYYSMDGSSPQKGGILYNGSIPLDKEGVYTIQAIAKDERGIYSEVTTVHYTIDYDAKSESPLKSFDD